MGADSALVFYGVRYTVTNEDREPLERERDPRQQAARRYKLDAWWGRYASESGEEEVYLFVGERLGSIGYEESFEVRRTRAGLEQLMERVGRKLERAAITRPPGLYVQFRPRS